MNRVAFELSDMHATPSLSSSVTSDQLDVAVRQRVSLAFLALGLFNNSIYVIILSAALDLAADVPKGVILFCNIAPALVAKVGWPYLLRGRVRYSKRIISCTILFIIGVLVVAQSASLGMRLAGISLASFASGLGEMTCLQLASTLGPDEISSLAVGWFSSGTGAAGFVGAGLWWVLRSLGVRLGLSLTALIPLGYAVAYFLVLPRTQLQNNKAAYAPVARDEDVAESIAPDDVSEESLPRKPLAIKEKMAIARPLLFKYMAPLFFVYLAEYTINQGVSPDLLYPVDIARSHFLFRHLIEKLSDYYPLWQLVYQSLVFVARSSTVVFGMPVLPRQLLYVPAMLQVIVLTILSFEAAHSWVEQVTGRQVLLAVLLLVALEGLLGGYAYVSAFSRLSSGDEESEVNLTRHDLVARKEFRMGCVGFADTSGILLASLVSMWLEPKLCRIQVDQGNLLCQEVRE